MYAQPHACSWNLSFNPLLFKSSRWVVTFPFVVSTEFFERWSELQKISILTLNGRSDISASHVVRNISFITDIFKVCQIFFKPDNALLFWQEKTNTPTLLWTAGTKTRWLLVTLPNSPISQFYKWKLSPHPQTPLMLGLLNTNSLASLSST